MRWPSALVVLGGLMTGCGFAPGASSDGNRPADAHARADSAAMDGRAIDAAAPSDWWNGHFRHRNAIAIDTSAVDTPLTAFPVLVPLPASAFDYTAARADGGDLRFVSDANVELPYELDTWAVGGPSFAWVAVDLPASTASKPRIWVYYGDATATSDANPHLLWSDAVSVHHLAALTDSSPNGHDATADGDSTIPAPVAGIVGGGRSFAGGTDALLLGQAAYSFTSAMSASAWIELPPFATGGAAVGFMCVLCKGDNAWRLQRNGTNAGLDYGTNNATNLTSNKAIDDSTWHHVAISYDGQTKSLYLDGALDSTQSAGAIDQTSTNLAIGENDDTNPQRNLIGLVDEVRIAALPRSATWIRAEYDTVHSATFTAMSPEEVLP